MKHFLILILMGLLIGCNPSTKESGNTEQIEQAALQAGNEISAAAQQGLGGQLKKAMGEGGPVHAVGFCNTAAIPILDSLTTDIPAKIRRASIRTRNPEDAPSETEKEIIEMYESALASGSQTTAVVRTLGESQVLYARPILLDNPLCLNCHGEAGTQVAEETLALLRELYPDDKALNHKMGDLRGIWSIVFNQDDLTGYLKRNSESN